MFAFNGGAEQVNEERMDPGAVAPEPGKPRKGNVLFVDPDDFLVDMIETGLSLSRPRWQIVSARNPSDALKLLEEHSELDAIITEIVFDKSLQAGKTFIREVAHRWPEIPIFVMTGVDPEETHGLETTESIAKPPDMDFLVSRVDRAIRRQRESVVRGIPLPTFLQIMEIEQKTCTVMVSHGGRVGEVYLRGGTLINARLDAMEGQEAFFALLSMRDHGLRVIDRCDADRKISTSLTSLLMEWSVRADHANRDDSPSGEEDQ